MFNQTHEKAFLTYGLNANISKLSPIVDQIFKRLISSQNTMAKVLDYREKKAKLADERAKANADEKTIAALEKEASEAKKRMTYVCFNGLPIPTEDGTLRRTNETMRPSGLLMLDYDHINDPTALHHKIIARATERGIDTTKTIALSHITVGGEGLRLVVKRDRQRNTVQEMDLWADIAGENVDPTCKDRSRASFIPQQHDVLLYRPEILFSPDPTFPYDEEIAPPKPKKVAKKRKKSISMTAGSPIANPAIYTTLYEAKHGIPQEGERHNHTLKMAATMKSITGGDAEELRELVPDYWCGASPQEYSNCLEYAASHPISDGPTPRGETVLEVANALTEKAKIEEAFSHATADIRSLFDSLEEGLEPELPTNLPEPIRLIVDTLPNKTKAYGAIAAFPLLGLYLLDVQFDHYRDGKIHPAILLVCVGSSNAGKSDIEKAKNFIIEPLRQQTLENEERFRQYKAQERAAKNSAKKPTLPQNLVMQIAPNDMTGAAMRDWMRMAEGHRLFFYAQEFESLYRLTDSKKKGDFLHDLKLHYDGADIGAARVTAECSHGSVKSCLNFIAHCTPQRFVNAMKSTGSIADGALSRLTLVMLEKEKHMRFDINDRIGDLTGTPEGEKLFDYIERLKSLSHTSVRCEEANKWNVAQLNRYAEFCETIGWHQFSAIYIRAVRSGYIRAMILWLMNDQVWSEDIENFATWSVEYDLWAKNCLFGEYIEEEFKKECEITAGRKSPYFKLLPDEFTIQQVIDLKRTFSNSYTDEDDLVKKSKNVVRNWKRNKLINYKDSQNKTICYKL